MGGHQRDLHAIWVTDSGPPAPGLLRWRRGELYSLREEGGARGPKIPGDVKVDPEVPGLRHGRFVELRPWAKMEKFPLPFPPDRHPVAHVLDEVEASFFVYHLTDLFRSETTTATLKTVAFGTGDYFGLPLAVMNPPRGKCKDSPFAPRSEGPEVGGTEGGGHKPRARECPRASIRFSPDRCTCVFGSKLPSARDRNSRRNSSSEVTKDLFRQTYLE